MSMGQTIDRSHTGLEGFSTFLRAYLSAGSDADLTVLIAVTELGESVAVIVIEGAGCPKAVTMVLTGRQCALSADIAEDTMNHFGAPLARAHGLPNLILALRQASSALAEIEAEPTP